MLFVLRLVPALKQQFNEHINGKSQTNRDQKPNLLFLQWHDQSQKFPIKLVNNRQKRLQRYWYIGYIILDTLHWIHCWIHYPYIGYYIGYIIIKKIGDCENNHSVNPLYLLVNHASGNIEEKNGNKYLIFDDSINENKRLLKICTCLGWH